MSSYLRTMWHSISSAPLSEVRFCSDNALDDSGDEELVRSRITYLTVVT